MSSVNKVILIGRLGGDVEMRSTAGGTSVANFSLATSETYAKDGQKQEKTEWHRIILWGKTAEVAAKYLRKGSKVFIEGKLQTRSWEDQASGQKKFTTEIVGQDMVFLDSKGSGGDGGGNQQQGAPAAAYESSGADSDIPF